MSLVAMHAHAIKTYQAFSEAQQSFAIQNIPVASRVTRKLGVAGSNRNVQTVQRIIQGLESGDLYAQIQIRGKDDMHAYLDVRRSQDYPSSSTVIKGCHCKLAMKLQATEMGARDCMAYPSEFTPIFTSCIDCHVASPRHLRCTGLLVFMHVCRYSS